MTSLADSLGIAPDALPSARQEAWRAMPLRAMQRRGYVPATAASVDAGVLAEIPTPRLVFVNGRLDETLSDVACANEVVSISHGDSGATVTDSAESRDSVFETLALSAPPTAVRFLRDTPTPLHVVHVAACTQDDMAWHQHLRVDVDSGVQARVVEHVIAQPDAAHLANQRTTVSLAQGARLEHVRVVEAGGGTLLQHSDATVAASAHYRRMDLDLGAAVSRHVLRIRLVGADAGVAAHGVLLGHGRRHAETRLDVVHGATDTRSDLQWRGLAADRARVVFHGGITIAEGADGSDAQLANRNLLLSDEAEINARPVLVIHADEVKAAHGATVGQLDASSLFYLRSRGIPETQARRMLTAAFVQSLLSELEDSALRDVLDAKLSAALTVMDASPDIAA